MTPDQFCYWLQGYFEISGSTKLNKEQVDVIKEHLSLVFNKVTTKKIQLNDFKDYINPKVNDDQAWIVPFGFNTDTVVSC